MYDDEYEAWHYVSRDGRECRNGCYDEKEKAKIQKGQQNDETYRLPNHKSNGQIGKACL